MRERYGLVGLNSGQLLTYQGRAILHDSKRELEWLFPTSRIVRVGRADLANPWMWLRNHPDMGAVRWPLCRSDFVDMTAHA